jgi:hypothetical protein
MKKILPNLPSVAEIQALFRKRDKRTYGGRAPKWKPGEQVRLQTRVRPNTHVWLTDRSKDAGISIGEIIDLMTTNEKNRMSNL